MVGSSSSKNFWIFHPGFLYGENAGELKNKAVSGFGGGSEGDNCKKCNRDQIMGRVYTYDSAKGIVAMSPAGTFFRF